MPKKLDIIHYFLAALLLGSIFFYNCPFNNHPTISQKSEEYTFLQAKNKADSLMIAEQYDQALLKFIEIDSQYQDQINIEAITALINTKRAEHETFLAIQTIDKPNNTVKKESNQISTKIVHSKEKVKLPEHQVTNTVKGVLQIINFDGAEIDYIGEVKDNKAHGFGFAVFEKKGFYKGEWANNKRSGEGVYYWQNGDVYEGHYLDGFKTGYGVYTFVTGDVYKGYWKDNLRHGEGILFNKRGKVITDGPWIKDEAIMKKRSKKK
jgi:hypothetical protein